MEEGVEELALRLPYPLMGDTLEYCRFEELGCGAGGEENRGR